MVLFSLGFSLLWRPFFKSHINWYSHSFPVTGLTFNWFTLFQFWSIKHEITKSCTGSCFSDQSICQPLFCLVYLNYLCSVWLLNAKSLSLILCFIGGIPIHSGFFFPFLDSLPIDVLLQCCSEVCDFESIPLYIIFVTLDIILPTDKSSQSI